MYTLGTSMYTLGTSMYTLGTSMYILGTNGPVPNGTLHVHLQSYGLTMAGACTCPLSPRARRVSHLSF